jgi:PAS domain S-box-containing protein
VAILEKIETTVSEAGVYRRAYLLSGDEQLVSSFNSAYRQSDSLFINLKFQYREFPKRLAMTDSLKSFVSEFFLNLKDGIELQRSKGNNPKLHKNINERSKVTQVEINTYAGKMKLEEQKQLEENKETAENSYAFSSYTMLGGILMSCIIFIAVFVVLRKRASGSFEAENQELSREELELIVRERTEEISQINRKLYKKVDELTKMDEALKQSEQYYRMLFEQAHDAIVIFLPENERVLDVNRRACDLYGFSREEFLAISLKSISKNMPQGEANIRSTLEKGYYHNFQSVHYKKDLTEMLIEINASVIDYAGKKAILSINRDITDRIMKIR